MTNQEINEINEAVARKLGRIKGQWGEYGFDPKPKEYCTDIRAAWGIVEEVVRSSDDLCLRFKLIQENKYCRAEFYTEAGGMGGHFTLAEEQAPTAPMAIALCFLQAVFCV